MRTKAIGIGGVKIVNTRQVLDYGMLRIPGDHGSNSIIVTTSMLEIIAIEHMGSNSILNG